MTDEQIIDLLVEEAQKEAARLRNEAQLLRKPTEEERRRAADRMLQDATALEHRARDRKFNERDIAFRRRKLEQQQN